MEELSLIDVSAEDDLLLDLASPLPLPPPPRPDPPRAGSPMGAEAASDLDPACGSPAAVGRAADPDGAMEEQAAPERTESPKQRKAKAGVNLRKSLAWDSAFFTSEGVLDTEELAIVNSTFRKTQGSRLPGIMEEIRRSGDSTTSTLEGETWAMESLETELFDNVRASIQRSLGKPNKVPGRPAATSKHQKATTNSLHRPARNGIDRIPQAKIRATVSTSQGVGGGKLRPQVTSKEPAAAPMKALPGAAEAKPSSKPPRALPRVATMRSSTNAAIASGISEKRSSTASMRPVGVTKSNGTSKSGAFTSRATTPLHGVTMDKADAKTKSATLNNYNRTAQRVPVRSSSRSDVYKTNPSRPSGNKIPARAHGDRASPSISPSSSVDSMSSVISGASTASTVGKISHTSENSNTLSPSLRRSNDHLPTTKLRPPVATERQSSGTAASGDNSRASAETTNEGKGSKPGLRRPKTEKKGFFDAEKSIDQNIGAPMQLHFMKIQCSLPATPKSQPSSTQNVNFASSCFDQLESTPTTAFHKETGASESKKVAFKVAQMEVEPFKAVEPEACTHQTDSARSIDQNVGVQMQLQPMKIQCSLPAIPKSQPSSTQNMHIASTFGNKESKSTAAQEDRTAFERKPVPLKVAQMEVEPFKVAEPETCTDKSGPIVAEPEAEKSFDQNVGAQVRLQSMKVHCSPPATPKSHPSAQSMQPVLSKSTSSHEASNAFESKPVPLKVAPTEVELCKVAEPEACTHESHPVVAEPEAEKSIDQNVVAQVQLHEDTSACKSPLTMEVLNSQPSSTFCQQESKPAAAPHVEISACKSKAAKAAPVKAAQMEVEPLKVAKPEACPRQIDQAVAEDTPKENIPALHRNIQANVDASSLVDLLTQKLSSISLGPNTP